MKMIIKIIINIKIIIIIKITILNFENESKNNHR